MKIINSVYIEYIDLYHSHHYLLTTSYQFNRFLFLQKKKLFFSAGTRTFVHEKIYDAFVAEATKLARERKVGSPFDANIQQGL